MSYDVHRLGAAGDDYCLGTRIRSRVLPANQAKDRPQQLPKLCEMGDGTSDTSKIDRQDDRLARLPCP